MMATVTENKGRHYIEGIRKQANSNIRRIFAVLNIKLADFGTRLVGVCPIPHQDSKTPNDNPHAFSWCFDRGIWACFSNHCERIHGSDVFGLIRTLKEFDGDDGFGRAIKFVKEILVTNGLPIEALTTQEFEQYKINVCASNKLFQHKALELGLLPHLKKTDYLIRRGIPKEVVEEFQSNGCWFKKGTEGHGRLIIPIHDPMEDYIVGFTCRMLDDKYVNEFNPKWIHCVNFAEMKKRAADKTEDQRIHTGSLLFSFHRARYHIGPKGIINICEGPIDVMKLWGYGFKNTVSILGTEMTQQKRELLLKIGVQRVNLILDGDPAGVKAAERFIKGSDKFFEINNLSPKLEGRDPKDLSKDELESLLNG